MKLPILNPRKLKKKVVHLFNIINLFIHLIHFVEIDRMFG